MSKSKLVMDRLAKLFEQGLVSYKDLNSEILNILRSKKDEIIAVSYSENLKPEISKIHKKFGVTKHVKMKSSYKFCVIATGEYDIYVAEPRASEWDIAAGHAILEHAGGHMTTHEEKKIFYGKDNYKNLSILAKRANNLEK